LIEIPKQYREKASQIFYKWMNPKEQEGKEKQVSHSIMWKELKYTDKNGYLIDSDGKYLEI
jgi:hypothetical protein